jgi:hypothetical protein
VRHAPALGVADAQIGRCANKKSPDGAGPFCTEQGVMTLNARRQASIAEPVNKSSPCPHYSARCCIFLYAEIFSTIQRLKNFVLKPLTIVTEVNRCRFIPLARDAFARVLRGTEREWCPKLAAIHRERGRLGHRPVRRVSGPQGACCTGAGEGPPVCIRRFQEARPRPSLWVGDAAKAKPRWSAERRAALSPR